MSGRSGYYSSAYEGLFADVDVYFSNGRTYQPLYVYFRPKKFRSWRDYYSSTYNQTYNDGYGYNFFTGEYSYYENSLNVPIDNSPMYYSMASTLGCLICMCACQAFCNREDSFQTPNDNDDSDERGRKRAHNNRIHERERAKEMEKLRS